MFLKVSHLTIQCERRKTYYECGSKGSYSLGCWGNMICMDQSSGRSTKEPLMGRLGEVTCTQPNL
jgi:hypothetical protein